MSFSYDVWNAEQAGKDLDKALLVSFEYQAKRLPNGQYENVEFIRIYKDRYSEVIRPVTDDDRVRFKDRYMSWKDKEEVPPEGTPLSQWPGATPADIAACKQERILTVEQLADAPDSKLQRSHLIGLKYRAVDWLKASERQGYMGELRTENEELKNRLTALEERLAQEKDKPKRGRPRKNESSNDSE